MADDRPMRIEGIGIRNYRQFKHIDVNNLPSMTVVVGANGTGKSVLFRRLHVPEGCAGRERGGGCCQAGRIRRTGQQGTGRAH